MYHTCMPGTYGSLELQIVLGHHVSAEKSNLVTLQDQQIPLTWLTDPVPKCNFFCELHGLFFIKFMLNDLFKVILRKFYL